MIAVQKVDGTFKPISDGNLSMLIGHIPKVTVTVVNISQQLGGRSKLAVQLPLKQLISKAMGQARRSRNFQELVGLVVQSYTVYKRRIGQFGIRGRKSNLHY